MKTGKLALATRVRKAAQSKFYYRRRGGSRMSPPRPLLSERARTRVIAALLHGVEPTVISRDQKVSRRLVLEIARAERILI